MKYSIIYDLFVSQRNSITLESLVERVNSVEQMHSFCRCQTLFDLCMSLCRNSSPIFLRLLIVVWFIGQLYVR